MTYLRLRRELSRWPGWGVSNRLQRTQHQAMHWALRWHTEPLRKASRPGGTKIGTAFTGAVRRDDGYICTDVAGAYSGERDRRFRSNVTAAQ